MLKQPDILILDEATSALDAESETLVNQALGVLLRGNNTTISIAHRLSTIKRSDRIICLGSDGRVAEEGTYAELSSRSDGAFAKLMEWQMSGGESMASPKREPHVTESEEIEADLEEGSEGDEAMDEAEGTKARKGNVTSGEAVLERTKPHDR